MVRWQRTNHGVQNEEEEGRKLLQPPLDDANLQGHHERILHEEDSVSTLDTSNVEKRGKKRREKVHNEVNWRHAQRSDEGEEVPEEGDLQQERLSVSREAQISRNVSRLCSLR